MVSVAGSAPAASRSRTGRATRLRHTLKIFGGDRRDLNSLGHAVTAHGLDSSPSITMVGTERVELFVFRLSSEGTAVVLRPHVSPLFDAAGGGSNQARGHLRSPLGEGLSVGVENSAISTSWSQARRSSI